MRLRETRIKTNCCFVVLVVGFYVAVVSAPPVHADETTYVADLNASGVPMLRGPEPLIGGGYQVCGAIRGGMPPSSAAQQFGLLNQWGPAIVSAAQHDLCPDTLH